MPIAPPVSAIKRAWSRLICRAVSGVEQRDTDDRRRIEPQVGAGTDAQRPGQAAGHVREEVAVLVQDQHDLELLGGHDDLAEEGVE